MRQRARSVHQHREIGSVTNGKPCWENLLPRPSIILLNVDGLRPYQQPSEKIPLKRWRKDEQKLQHDFCCTKESPPEAVLEGGSKRNGKTPYASASLVVLTMAAATL